MISIAKDRKSATYIITKTDNEGYHRQMNVTEEELNKLKELIIDNDTHHRRADNRIGLDSRRVADSPCRIHCA